MTGAGRAGFRRGLVVLLVLVAAVTGPGASAHLAIRLDVRAPAPGARVPPDTEAVVFAQPMLGGVDRVTFSATLDDRPLDPASGRPTDRPVAVELAASATRRIPLQDLAPGPHRFSVSYRPDVDSPPMSSAVDFVVVAGSGRPARTRAGVLVGALLLSAWLVVVAVVLVRARHRTSETRGGASSRSPGA